MEQRSVVRFRQYILDGEYQALFAQDTVSGHESLRNGKPKSTFELVTEGLTPQKQQLLSYFIHE